MDIITTQIHFRNITESQEVLSPCCQRLSIHFVMFSPWQVPTWLRTELLVSSLVVEDPVHLTKTTSMECDIDCQEPNLCAL